MSVDRGRLATAGVLALVMGCGPAAAAHGPSKEVTIVVDQSRGVDSRVAYPTLVDFGPWDDRNYLLSSEDLELLAADEAALRVAVPAFARVGMRREHELLDEGPVQYPRSALPKFITRYGGYLVEGVLYRAVDWVDGAWRLLPETARPLDAAELEVVETAVSLPDGFLEGEARVTSPEGAAESAVAINPVDPDIVIAGTNWPTGGQRMHVSTDGGETWSQSAMLPGGGTCCDPTVGWSADGSKAYTATLGFPPQTPHSVWFYRSGDGGQTWNDLGADPRREIGDDTDKEYLHVDTSPVSPHLDNIYLTWKGPLSVMHFSRSTDFGDSWSTPLAFDTDDAGIGSDITTDTAGNVYYLYPAFQTRLIRLKKSTDGGQSFAPQVTVAATEGSFIFPVPSMDVREVFIYVSADTDRSGGEFRDSIYASWTDNTGPDSADPALNHARIQVAYSRDGGSSWTVTTPHETADASTVDRWHQWLAVAPDGSVHVIFYDTRRDLPNRAQVDLFHSVSEDGAQTWSTPERLTAVQSPNISGPFEFGDYNGLDIVMNDLIAVYTDNRPESSQLGDDSVDVYAAGEVLPSIFSDGFESGDTSAWSTTIP